MLTRPDVRQISVNTELTQEPAPPLAALGAGLVVAAYDALRVVG